MSFGYNKIKPHYVYNVIKQTYNRTTDQFICWITSCGKGYTNVQHFVDHLYEQHQENGQLVYCHCGLPFISDALLVKHRNKEHAENISNHAPEPKLQIQPVFQSQLLNTPISTVLTAQVPFTFQAQPQPELFLFSPFPSQMHQQFFALPHQAQPDLPLAAVATNQSPDLTITSSIHSQPTTTIVSAVTPPFSFSEIQPTQQPIGLSSTKIPPDNPLNYTIIRPFNVLIELQSSSSIVPELPTQADVSPSTSKPRPPSSLLYLNEPYSPLKLCLQRRNKPRFKEVNSTNKEQPPIPLLRPAPQFSTVFICTGCKCFSRFPSGLDTHCSEEHNPPTACKPTLQCGRCNVCFEMKAKLFRHMYKKHSEGTPLHCSRCSQIFWLFDDLLEHYNQCPLIKV